MRRVFRFDPEKSLQAVAFLLRREPGHRMNCMRLLKVLYVAEREALRESSRPITGGRVVATMRGPILDDVLRSIRGQHLATPRWAECLRLDNYYLEMFHDPGVGRLSQFVTEKLDDVARRYQANDECDMVEITRKFPEWQRNDPGKGCEEIPLEHILDAVGRGADLVKIVEAAERDAKAAAFFAEAEVQQEAQPA
jgi:uncharacterized phage-associated protein